MGLQLNSAITETVTKTEMYLYQILIDSLNNAVHFTYALGYRDAANKFIQVGDVQQVSVSGTEYINMVTVELPQLYLDFKNASYAKLEQKTGFTGTIV